MVRLRFVFDVLSLPFGIASDVLYFLSFAPLCRPLRMVAGLADAVEWNLYLIGWLRVSDRMKYGGDHID